MHHRHIGGIQRVGQNPHGFAIAGKIAKISGSFLSRYKIGGHQIQLLFDPPKDRAKPRNHQLIAGRNPLSFGGIVCHQLHLGPFRGQTTTGKTLHAVLHRALQLCGFCAVLHRRNPRGKSRRVAGASDDPFQFKHRLAVPIGIKHRRRFRHDGPCGQHIQIHKENIVTQLEIFIANVAATNDRHRTVNDDGFIVHTPVHTKEIKGISQHLRAAQGGWVKQPDLEIFPPVQRR